VHVLLLDVNASTSVPDVEYRNGLVLGEMRFHSTSMSRLIELARDVDAVPSVTSVSPRPRNECSARRYDSELNAGCVSANGNAPYDRLKSMVSRDNAANRC
jgi:hypothetical protein